MRLPDEVAAMLRLRDLGWASPGAGAGFRPSALFTCSCCGRHRHTVAPFPGSLSSRTIPPEVRAAYVDALRDGGHVHAICEEYRAAATLDRAHDAADLAAGTRITYPLLALWSDHGGLATWYAAEGGPLGLWRRWADDVRGHAIRGGHFFLEDAPEATAVALHSFFAPH